MSKTYFCRLWDLYGSSARNQTYQVVRVTERKCMHVRTHASTHTYTHFDMWFLTYTMTPPMTSAKGSCMLWGRISFPGRRHSAISTKPDITFNGLNTLHLNFYLSFPFLFNPLECFILTAMEKAKSLHQEPHSTLLTNSSERKCVSVCTDCSINLKMRMVVTILWR